MNLSTQLQENTRANALLILVVGLFLFMGLLSGAMYYVMNDPSNLEDGYRVVSSDEAIAFDYSSTTGVARVQVTEAPEDPVQVFVNGEDIDVSEGYPLVMKDEAVEFTVEPGDTVTVRTGMLFDNKVIAEYEIIE